MFVGTDLGGGGAERTISILLEHIDRRKFELCLVLLRNRCEYPIPNAVPVIYLSKKNWYDYPKLVWKLSRVYRKWNPNVVLSFLTYTNIIVYLAKKMSRLSAKLILCEHRIPSYFISQKRDPISFLFNNWIPRCVYKYADKVVCVSSHAAVDLHHIYKIPHEKIKVIHNPVDIQKIRSLSREDVEHPWFTEKEPVIISAGRLVEIKDYPNLLRAFKQVVNVRPSRLMILGRGEPDKSLLNLSKQLGIDDKVSFLGFQSNPFKYMIHADLFVLASKSEAFPMAIIEAITCGLPIVSTSTPGACEIITDGKNGLLVPIADDKALARAMLKILSDKKLAHKLTQANKNWINDISISIIIPKYEELLKQ